MVPDRFRLRASAEFRRVLRRGVKARRARLVMYAAGGTPGFGVIVGKSVGGAVARNRVKRRLRHLAAAQLRDEAGLCVVVRALPLARVEGPGLVDDFVSAWREVSEALA